MKIIQNLYFNLKLIMLYIFHTVNYKTHLAHAIICKFDVSLRIQKHIVQFQISINDSPLMEVVERQTDLCWVKSERDSEVYVYSKFDTKR